MLKTHPNKSGYGPMYESSSSIASLLRSAANPYRVKLLALAMNGDGDFAGMIEATGLSKTALANHLGQLVENGLMRRQSRGRYELTADGKELLSAAFLTYGRSARRAEEEKDAIRRSYGMAYGQPDPLGRRMISMDARYEPCWLSLLGAVTGSLNALGTKTTLTDVGGYTGYSFLINVSKGETCPSGPTALHIKTFLEALSGIECLGWQIQNRTHAHSYPSRPGPPSGADLKVAREVFERVRKEIDHNDRPVVLFGLGAPEYGIVRGYEGESYIVSTFRGLSNPGIDEEPVPYHKLNAPGCIVEICFAEQVRVRPAKARKEALARALRFAEGDVETARGYLSGPTALAEWARVLEETPEDSQNYMGNGYVGACVREGRELSSAFLRKVARRAVSTQSRHLSRASVSYSKGAKSLAEFTKLFPFRFEGRMPVRKRRRGAELLLEAQGHEEHAIQHMRKLA